MARFLAVGAGATLIQYLVLILLVELVSMPAIPASVLAYTLSALGNYWLNYTFTFASQAKHLLALTKFFTVAGISLILNAALMYLGVKILGIYYLIAQLMATLVVLIWNFLAHKFWTYKSERTAKPYPGEH